MLRLKTVIIAVFFSLYAFTGRAALEDIIIHSAGKAHLFHVEVARTPEEQKQGLMHRTSLPPDQGMLFVFGAPYKVSMWMKDTPLSLDMLFVDGQGVITQIAQNTVPESEAIIASEVPVYSVLELGGGTCSTYDIKAGDRVERKKP